MLLKLQANLIYGPVLSRRLGRSLGVNILPRGKKVCCFDCLYCQYGLEKAKTQTEIQSIHFPSPDDIFSALKQALKELPQPPAYITFSGNGEATLHPDFYTIVQGIKEIRDAYSPISKTAILSNSLTVTNQAIRNALAILDGRIMKLDAGTEEMFQTYNHPTPGITLENIVSSLETLPDVTIQTLFTGGPQGNFSPTHINAWIQQLKRIAPIFVQIYSLDRDSPSLEIEKVTRADLESLRIRLEDMGIPAGIY